MKVSLGKTLAAVLVLGIVSLVVAVTTSAPHGQEDPPLADAAWLLTFACVAGAVILLLAIGVRAAVTRGRSS